MVLNTSSDENPENNVFMNKKIVELLGPIDNSVVNLIFDRNYLSEKFVKIEDI